MYAQRHTLTVVTDDQGDATAFLDIAHGRIHSIQYVKDGTSPYADGVDFDITSEETGQAVWDEDDVNASATVFPVTAAQTTAGVDSTLTEAPIVLANDRLKIVVGSGGDTKTGTFHITIT